MNNDIENALESFKKQDYKKAVQSFEEALKTDKNNPHVLNNMGLCYSKMMSDDMAEQYYLKALQMDNKMVQTYINIVDLYYKQKRLQESINILETAITLLSDDVVLKHYLARIYIEDFRYDMAIDQLSEILDKSPKNTDAYWDLANVYYELGEYDNAISNYEQVLEYVQTNPIIFYQTALAYEANDNLDKSISNHLKAISLNQDFCPSYKKLGILFMAKENNEDAVEYFNDYLKFELPEQEKQIIVETIARISNKH